MTSAKSVEINAFDTNTTSLYKYARAYKIPAVYVSVLRVPTNTPSEGQLKYVNTFSKVINSLSKGNDGREVYSAIKLLNPKFNIDVMIYLLVQYAQSSKMTPQQTLDGVVYIDTINRIGGSRFTKEEHINNHMQMMEQRLRSYRQEDDDRMAVIEMVQGGLLSTPITVRTSEFNISGHMYNVSPVRKSTNAPLKLDEGIDIFNDSQATIFLPFIQYNDSDGERYYRIIKGDLSYEKLGITRHVSTNREPDTFYFTLWLGNRTMSMETGENITDLFDATILSTAHKTSFYYIVYSLKTGVLNISVPEKEGGIQVDEIEEIFARIESGLRGMDVRFINQIKYKGNFELYNIDLDEATFLHAILHPMYSPFIYVEERLRPFCFKARMDVHYRDLFSRTGEQVVVTNTNGTTDVLASTSISTTVNLIKLGSDANLRYVSATGEVKTHLYKAGSRHLRFTVNGGASSDEVAKCILHMRSFFSSYKLVRDDIRDNIYSDFQSNQLQRLTDRYRDKSAPLELDEYGEPIEEQVEQSLYHFIDPLSDETLSSNEKPSQPQRGYTKHIDELKAQVPDLFVNGYAQACQNYAQPLILADNQVKEWGASHNGQVMQFPRTHKYVPNDKNKMVKVEDPLLIPQMWLGCPNPAYPNIGVKRNRYLSNKEDFSHVPCCFVEEQMKPNTNTQYNEYYNGRVLPSKTVKLGTKHKTDKILDPGTIGIIPRVLNMFLSLSRNPDELTKFTGEWEFVHYGVPDTPNSLLHCICEAIDDQKYDGSEEYVIKLRRLIARETHPGLLKQEMYDYSDEAILNLLNDTNRYLDPSLFYRALEEYFHINLYVFNTYRDAYRKDLSGIVVPRNRNFHVRPNRMSTRATVLILTHYGPASHKRDYPHTELLVDFNDDKKAVVKLFGIETTRNVYDGFTAFTNNISWLPHLNTPVLISQPPPKLYPHDNIYGKLDYAQVLLGTGTLISQYIDSIGKARAFTIRYGKLNISYVTLPAQPENVPVTTSLARPSARDVLRTLENRLNTPFSRSVNAQGLTDGIWYQMFEIREGIYIPIQPTTELPSAYKHLRIGSGNPIKNIASNNVTLRYMNMNRTLHIIYDLVEWLFELLRREMPNAYRPENFTQNEQSEDPSNTTVITDALIRRTFTIGKYTGDSAKYYDFTKLSRQLPDAENVEEALEYLSILPHFEKRKFPMYNMEFAVKIRAHLAMYEKRTYGEAPFIRGFVENYFTTSSDFKQVKGNVVLMGSDIFDRWMDDRKIRERKIYEIKEKVTMSIAIPYYPILYMDKNKRIYIVQNTSAAGKLNALHVGKIWAEKNVNPGFLTKALDPNLVPPHFVYIIAVNEQIMPIENHTGNYDAYVNIISYSDDRYGTLLPLL